MGRRRLSAQLAFAAQEGAVAVGGYHHEADEGQDERHVDGGHAQQFHLVDDGGLKRGQHATTEDGHDETGCAELGIDIIPAMNRMIVVDYIIANEDRHLNNFGLVREAESLKWLGAAPIFDSGSSFGYDKLPFEILSGKHITCKPFKNHHE